MDYKELIIGLLAGFIAGVIFVGSNIEDYKSGACIEAVAKGYALEHCKKS